MRKPHFKAADVLAKHDHEDMCVCQRLASDFECCPTHDGFPSLSIVDQGEGKTSQILFNFQAETLFLIFS